MNYMEQVAKMLGVEIGEKFQVTEKRGEKDFLISGDFITFYDGIHHRSADGFHNSDTRILSDILTGEYTIKKIPFKPSLNEKYWAFQCTQGEVELQYLKWRDDHIDNTLYKIGDCYPTQEAAEQHIPQWEAFFADKGQVDVLKMNGGKTE